MLHQEVEGQVRQVTLEAGQAALNGPGAISTAVFVTAGMGTQVRPR